MTATPGIFVGFGFGAIQAGLFLYEAFRSGNFTRLVVAEIVPDLVAAIRRAQGCYRVNIATRSGIQVQPVRGLEILNPRVPADAVALAEALAEATEICTALPSVEFYARGEPSVAGLLAQALQRKAAHDRLPPCVVYTAENHNRAAEILQELCERGGDGSSPAVAGVRNSGGRAAPTAFLGKVQFLNTVIGKMSGVVTDPEDIRAARLACLADGFAHAFLVEEFNRILISRIDLPGFQPGLDVFLEKPDLLPFEEAKLYGHNAVHALLGYLARRQGARFMSEVAADPRLMTLAREAFREESGPALIARHGGLDPLFTPAGFLAYSDDLLARMTNPSLRDRTDRVTRDTPRKLAWGDRLVGTMRLALDAGIVPVCFAFGAAAALDTLPAAGPVAARLHELWPEPDQPPGRKSQLIALITKAQQRLMLRDSLLSRQS